nr:DUF1345 domain-containing protein [Novosphingobium hassiacum]
MGNRIAPPRFLLFLGTLIASFGGLWFLDFGDLADAVVLSFDLAALVFLLSLIPLTRKSDAATLRHHADANDANRMLVLIVTTVATLVVMAAIAGELPNASAGDRMSMVKLVGTLILTWLFANSVYALHYAHLYYSSRPKTGGDSGGIDFPGDDAPDYLDFAYFSFTLGMTFQTSDVQISGRSIRRIATLHSFAAFIFNIGVIAFTINALG